ncbi:hypothetical protein [Kingella oralis]|nr:hypothetical protein [Kingella oralis]
MLRRSDFQAALAAHPRQPEKPKTVYNTPCSFSGCLKCQRQPENHF